MRFDNLYKLMINTESEEIEDLAELDTDITTDKTPDQMSEDEKIDYLVQNSTIIQTGKGGAPLSPTERVKKAKDAIDNGFFDALYDGIQIKKDAMNAQPEVDALEELPADLELDEPTDEDVEDVPALGDFRKEKRQQDMEEEEFSGQEI